MQLYCRIGCCRTTRTVGASFFCLFKRRIYRRDWRQGGCWRVIDHSQYGVGNHCRRRYIPYVPVYRTQDTIQALPLARLSKLLLHFSTTTVGESANAERCVVYESISTRRFRSHHMFVVVSAPLVLTRRPFRKFIPEGALSCVCCTVVPVKKGFCTGWVVLCCVCFVTGITAVYTSHAQYLTY